MRSLSGTGMMVHFLSLIVCRSHLFNNRSVGVGDTVADNVVQFLENYRNSLLSGRFEFLEDIGVIEKMGASKK